MFKQLSGRLFGKRYRKVENESFRLRINSMIDIIFKEKAVIPAENANVSRKYKRSAGKISIGLISSVLLVEFL